jgi:hypothetical protein
MRKSVRALLCLTAVVITILPVALAQGATSAPTVSTSPATGVNDTSAKLNGTVTPDGQQTSYAFQWGPTTGYGHETPLTSAGSGTGASSVGATVSGLASGSTYHFRIIAMNPSGTSVGADQSFATTGTAPPPSTPPAASTGSAGNVSASGATVTGTVKPAGQSTTYYFEYGPSSNYGFETSPTSAGAGLTEQSVSANLSGLPVSTTFHYRVVAVSNGGTALGSDKTFTTTTPPAASTGGATRVDVSSARLNGTVNPRGQAASYYFQYGTTTTYGLQTRPVGAGSGTGDVAAFSDIAQLQSNTTYHYRLVAQSAGGTSDGADQTFKTSGPAQTPSHVVFMGRMGFASPGGIIGVEAGCMGGQTGCAGKVAMYHDGSLIGQRSFYISPNSGGFQNIGLSYLGKQLLRDNGVWRLMAVDVEVTTTSGQQTSQVMHLARWVWH